MEPDKKTSININKETWKKLEQKLNGSMSVSKWIRIAMYLEVNPQA